MKKLFIRIREAANKHSSWRKFFSFFIVTQAIYGIMLYFSIPKVMQYADGMKILDMLPMGYSVEYAQKLFAVLGEAGRSTYLFQQIPLDIFYPGLFAITYVILFVLIFRIIFSKESEFQNLIIVPILAGIFDYCENVGIVIMLSIYPTFQPWLAGITNIFSILKSCLTVLVFIILIIAIVMLAMQKIKQARKSL